MVDIFGNLEELKKKVSETAEVVTKKTGEVVSDVAKKTEQTVSIQKIKNQIRVMEKNNDRDYKDIGKMVYEKYQKEELIAPEYLELCEAIEERESSIENFKRDIAELKGLDICPNCKDHVEVGAAYCSKCGAKLAESIFEDEDEDEVFEVEE